MSAPASPPRLFLVGNLGGTNVGDSFLHAAKGMGIDSRFFECRDAHRAPGWVRKLCWHLLGHRPPRLGQFNRTVLAAAEEFRPDTLVSTGLVPLTADALAELGRRGVRRINYLADDPWNPSFRSRWFLRGLQYYDVVYSPRRANLDDLRRAGVPRVEYLPFGYDPRFFYPDECRAEGDVDVMFAGGADPDRVPLLGALVASGLRVALYGAYWENYAETRAAARGHADPATLRRATAAAKIALCLVRRSNRDGHVMRTFEIAATGACMLAEDTPEHRDLFGADGFCVAYFRTPGELVARARALAADPPVRARLADGVRTLIASGRHSYADRLRTLLTGGPAS